MRCPYQSSDTDGILTVLIVFEDELSFQKILVKYGRLVSFMFEKATYMSGSVLEMLC